MFSISLSLCKGSLFLVFLPEFRQIPNAGAHFGGAAIRITLNARATAQSVFEPREAAGRR